MSEFFPDKFTPLEGTIVGQAAVILALLDGSSLSVGQLFVQFKQESATATYDGFVAALSFLYGAGVVEYENQVLRIF